MEVYVVKDKKILAPLFAGWHEALIWSCLQDCMGMSYADDLESPQSAQLSLGEFCFFAGVVNDALI